MAARSVYRIGESVEPSQLEGFYLRNVHLVIVDNESFGKGGRTIDKPFASIPLGLRAPPPRPPIFVLVSMGCASTVQTLNH